MHETILPERLVVFAHGMESGPWGDKITALAKLARARGWAVESPDYSSTMDADARVSMLEDLAPAADKLVLVGSSMGGYVSAQACAALKPDGLLLMAPALYFESFQGHDYSREPSGIPPLAASIHGWQDDVVPAASSIRFAQTHGAELHMVHAGHSLTDQIPFIEVLLNRLLDQVEAVAA